MCWCNNSEEGTTALLQIGGEQMKERVRELEAKLIETEMDLECSRKINKAAGLLIIICMFVMIFMWKDINTMVNKCDELAANYERIMEGWEEED